MNDSFASPTATPTPAVLADELAGAAGLMVLRPDGSIATFAQVDGQWKPDPGIVETVARAVVKTIRKTEGDGILRKVGRRMR